jgi:hypothetical protein
MSPSRDRQASSDPNGSRTGPRAVRNPGQLDGFEARRVANDVLLLFRERGLVV